VRAFRAVTGLFPGREDIMRNGMASRIRTTVVGSYPVLPWMVGNSSRLVLRDAIMAVLKTQELAGLELVSDGELGRFDPSNPETNGMIISCSSSPAAATKSWSCSRSLMRRSAWPSESSTKNNEVETPDLVASRIEQIVEAVGHERVHYVNPDCGFWMLQRSVGRSQAAGIGGRTRSVRRTPVNVGRNSS
jgi:hypothetical protein